MTITEKRATFACPVGVSRPSLRTSVPGLWLRAHSRAVLTAIRMLSVLLYSQVKTMAPARSPGKKPKITPGSYA